MRSRSPVEPVLLVSEDGERLRFLADCLWRWELIVYCAGSATETVQLLIDGLRPTCVLVDPILGDEFVVKLQGEISTALPTLSIDVRRMPLPSS
jgi:hypothetical protein